MSLESISQPLCSINCRFCTIFQFLAPQCDSLVLICKLTRFAWLRVICSKILQPPPHHFPIIERFKKNFLGGITNIGFGGNSVNERIDILFRVVFSTSNNAVHIQSIEDNFPVLFLIPEKFLQSFSKKKFLQG